MDASFLEIPLLIRCSAGLDVGHENLGRGGSLWDTRCGLDLR